MASGVYVSWRKPKSAILQGIVRGLVCGAVGGAVIACFIWAAGVGLERESARMDAERLRNCELYGQAINKLYGAELCAPTPHG